MSVHESIIKSVERDLMNDKRRMTANERLFFKMGLHFQQEAADKVFRSSGEQGIEAFASDMLTENEAFVDGDLHEFHKMFCENCAANEGKPDAHS